MAELEQRPVAKSELDVEELEDEIVVNHPDRQKVYNFNGTAAFIWSLSNGDYTLSDIVDEIHTVDPTVPREEIAEDVLEFVEDLQDKNLIQLRN